MDFRKPTKPGPYIARSASDKTDDWPAWYVAGPDGIQNYLTDLGGWREDRTTPIFVPKLFAISLAEKWNGDTK
jgi:hypothetical protein